MVQPVGNGWNLRPLCCLGRTSSSDCSVFHATPSVWFPKESKAGEYSNYSVDFLCAWDKLTGWLSSSIWSALFHCIFYHQTLTNFCACFVPGTEATQAINDHRGDCWSTCWRCSSVYTLDLSPSLHQRRCNHISGLMFT